MKKRLDALLLERGLCQSRERARAMIMAGEVRVAGRPETKCGAQFAEDAELAVTGAALPFVSRGGLKLQKALAVFPIDLTGRVCADVGASTGGFTDCMLQSGALRVYAIDVGYGQLDWKLRSDARVIVMERTNARFMEPSWFEAAPSFASVDVSFISLALIVPPLFRCLSESAEAVTLVKPQFEAGRAEVGKHGVVRDAAVHARVLRQARDMAAAAGFVPAGVSFSPITGPQGNIEFLLRLCKGAATEDIVYAAAVSDEAIQDVVVEAHRTCI